MLQVQACCIGEWSDDSGKLLQTKLSTFEFAHLVLSKRA
jgi:hypothetical protein